MLCFFLLFSTIICKAQTTSQANCEKIFSQLNPSGKGRTEQNLDYQLYAFCWKRWFGFRNRWFVVVTDSLTTKTFALKGKEAVPLENIWQETFCLAAQQYQIKAKRKNVQQGEFSFASYYYPKRKVRKLLRNLWKINPIFVEKLAIPKF
jgi:hypothetical protein